MVPDGLFKKNLELLATIDRTLWQKVQGDMPTPDYQIIPSREGLPILEVKGTILHSRYHPTEEARRWVKHQLEKWDGFTTPIIYGLGLGYHIEELAKSVERGFLVIEPDVKVFRIALHYLDLSRLIGRTAFSVEPSEDELSRIIKRDSHLMAHNPTVNLHPTLYQKVRRCIGLQQRYRILTVGPIYGGSSPIARYVTSALVELGYEVELMDCSIFADAFHSLDRLVRDGGSRERLRGLFTLFLSELVLAKVMDYRPDLVFALAQAPLTKESLLRLKNDGVPTAFWFVEDYRTMNYWREIAPFYDYFFTIQEGEFFCQLKELGLDNFHYLPLAASPEWHRPLDLTEEELHEYGSDLSFVGAGYYNRRNLFLRLIDFDLKIWGNEWEGALPLLRYIQRKGERVSTEETVKIFNASKINLNLHSSNRHEGINPYGDFVNPRTFEIAACGAFQLVDYRRDLPRFFNLSEELVCFQDVEDLRKKISYFLARPTEREEIARRARQRVLREHTYKKRMQELMSFLLDRGFKGSGRLPGKYLVRDLLREARKDRELASYLARFLTKKHSLTLTDIVSEIRQGKGGLTKPETIFLMLEEIGQRRG